MALAEMEKSKSLVIFMNSLASLEVLNKIKDVLAGHTGNAQVYLQLGVGPTAKKIKTQSSVRISPELVENLKKIHEISKVDAV
jgi:hypothetical protein